MRTFHGRLLAAAIDRGVAVQPVAVQYLRDGQIDPVAPFVGDDDLVAHLLRLFAQPRAQVCIHLLPPIGTVGKERALLAMQAQQAIHLALYGFENVEAAPRRPARAA